MTKIRKYGVLLILCFSVSLLFCMPAWRGEVEKRLADGSTITVTLTGDRWLHYYTSADGRCWRETADGILELIDKPTDTQEEYIRRQKRMPKQAATASARNIASRGLVILANFKKTEFKSEHTQALLNDMLNGDNYTYNGATGSARQYFSDQSMGSYKPQFDVVGPVTLSYEYSHYGEDDTSVGYAGEDLRAVDMIVEACQLADKNFGVNFKDYDCDNDGEVDFVFVIYAGYGQSAGADAGTIWPHAFWVSDFHGDRAGGQTCIIDGKKINTYACGPELYGASGSTLTGVGTFCHEFSHVLGLPDLYITSGSSKHTTLNTWDILDYGPYLNNGRTPPAYSAYERFFMGWLTPTVINRNGTYLLKDLKETNSAAMITSSGQSNLIGNDPNPTEFYLLENRQQTGWDKYLKGHGLMITRIKYNYQNWYDNEVNNSETNMGVDLIEASQNTTKYSMPTDLFPAGATQYTPYNKYPITNIQETDNIITFNLIGGGDSIIVSVDDINDNTQETVVAVYTIQGILVRTGITDLPEGVYIIKTDKRTRKIYVK